MTLFFCLFLPLLVGFTFGFATACIMATAGHADRRDRRPFLPGPYDAGRGAPASPIHPPRSVP